MKRRSDETALSPGTSIRARVRPWRAPNRVTRYPKQSDIPVVSYALLGGRCRDRREYRLRANWKVVVENFLECYHCQVAHPSFADAIDLNSYEIDEYRYVSTQHGPPKHEESAAKLRVKEGRYNYLWPTFMLNIYPGPGNASTNQIVPIDADNTLAVYEYFYDDDPPDNFATETTGLIHQVMVEDITLCESVQRGMHTGTFEHGRLMLRYEHAIRHFQNLVRESLAE